jgi:hypothetical protein
VVEVYDLICYMFRNCSVSEYNEVTMISALRFGKLPPKIDYRTLSFGNYLKEDIEEPPESVSLTVRVFENLGDKRTDLIFPMFANDQLGDCTVAGMAHGVTVYHGMVTQRHIPELSEVVRIYNHLTGGFDSGLYLLDVVKYWRSTGIEDNQILAYTTLNNHNRVHVKQAINLFGGLLMGFQCQEKVMEEFKAKKPWKPGHLINAGHAVYVTGYDTDYVEVLTWGSTQKGTWAWWDRCVDEAYVLLPPEAKLPEFAPGFDFERLQKDLAEVAII